MTTHRLNTQRYKTSECLKYNGCIADKIHRRYNQTGQNTRFGGVSDPFFGGRVALTLGCLACWLGGPTGLSRKRHASSLPMVALGRAPRRSLAPFLPRAAGGRGGALHGRCARARRRASSSRKPSPRADAILRGSHSSQPAPLHAASASWASRSAGRPPACRSAPASSSERLDAPRQRASLAQSPWQRPRHADHFAPLPAAFA